MLSSFHIIYTSWCNNKNNNLCLWKATSHDVINLWSRFWYFSNTKLCKHGRNVIWLLINIYREHPIELYQFCFSIECKEKWFWCQFSSTFKFKYIRIHSYRVQQVRCTVNESIWIDSRMELQDFVSKRRWKRITNDISYINVGHMGEATPPSTNYNISSNNPISSMTQWSWKICHGSLGLSATLTDSHNTVTSYEFRKWKLFIASILIFALLCILMRHLNKW